MKKSLLILLAIMFIASAIVAQNDIKSGVVTYEKTRKLELKIQGDAHDMENSLPKERKSLREMIFTQDFSLYRNATKKQEDEVVKEAEGGGMMMIKMVEPEEYFFSDIKGKVNTEQREFMGRKFLIEAKTDTVQWKMTGNQKTILNYPCMEAELVGSEKKTIAWFTPMISVSTGPDGYVGLPGLILAMDIDNGKTLVEVKTIEAKAIDSKELAKPKEGKKVTYAEFRKIVDDKMKEMNGGQGGNVFIIRSERNE